MTTKQTEQINKLADLYINDIKFENLKEIEEILICGNEPFCYFKNTDLFYEHYQKFSKIKNLEKTKNEMILEYFAFNQYINKQNNNISKVNKHDRFDLKNEEYFYNVLEIYKNKTN